MSKISISGAATGTATFTIESPATNTNRTLNLPDNAGTFITTGSTTGIDASALSTGTVAAARLPAGSVLQVVQNSSTSNYSTTSSTFQAATNHNVTITPSSASSKILLIHQGMVNSLASQVWCWATIYRGATNLYAGGANDAAGGVYMNGSIDSHCPITFVTLDSPNTTSATTYTVHFKNNNNSTTVRYNPDGWKLYFVAMEIAG